MGGFEYREPEDRNPEYWQEVEELVDTMISATDVAIHSLFNRIIAKNHEEDKNA